MADEPRRSVRATKGQHTMKDQLDQTPEPPKKKASKKSKKPENEEPVETEVIRCVCGALETLPNDKEPWIACDMCDAWQHNVCVGITTFEEDIPDNYQCEQCNPEGHKELLDGLKRGIKVWEDRRKRYLLEKARQDKEEAKKDVKKDVKKGKKKGKRASDSKTEINGKSSAPATPVPEKTKKDAASTRAGSAKRKERDESQDKELLKEPKAKSRKISAPNVPPRQESPTSDLPTKIADIKDPVKEGGARILQKSFKVTVPVAIKNGVYVLAPNDTVDSKTERLAISIAYAVAELHPSPDSFSPQARSIAANLKTNQELTNNLLVRKLLPLTLAGMSSDDMASKELKRAVGEIKARNDKQAIMVTDDGPRVRRTHKGEEVIESDNFAMTSDTTSISRRRSMLDPNASMAARSRENSPGDQVELPAEEEAYPVHNNNSGLKLAFPPKASSSVRKSSQADFDIQKVFSSVSAQSPTTPHPRRESSNNAPPIDGPGVDPEIDKLLQDDDGDSDAYSPTDYPADPDVVWSGIVTMDSVASFPASAKHVAGMAYETSADWEKYLQKDLKVAGRIDQEKANEYLCSLRYSPPTDVVVVEILPAGEHARKQFLELYNYFETRKRFGVLTNKGPGNIRDTYLVPVPPSPASMPDFIGNLEDHKVPEHRLEPMILITLVIRNEWPPAPVEAVAQSPTAINDSLGQMSMVTPNPPLGSIGPPMQPQPYQPLSQEEIQHRQHLEEQRLIEQRNGEAVAVEILGVYRDAPTVAFLMPQAFQMRPVEWHVIKGILEEDDQARHDLQHLSQVLEIRMQSLQPPQQQ
ncbi:hypothetical protein LZ554_007665 [Drepanopeziza brunnea f. sp. 'monogermtubi']|nr:hypothetical protein LZ554_007665 [Drepanopeziza brunnea f. sp. 'monogermtubi']